MIYIYNEIFFFFFYFRVTKTMPMQIDGEPWMQAAAEVNMFFSLGNLVILRKLIP